MKKNQHLISIRGAKGKGGGGSTFEADDNMFARQSAAFIDALCEGPIKGLVYGDASILIDEVRLRNVNEATGRISSTSNFNNFTVITKNGDATQVVDADFFAEYPSAATTKNIGSAELLEGEPQYFTISSGTFEKRETDYVKITISTTGMSAITKKGDNQGDVNETNVFFTIEFNWVDNSGVHHTREMFDTGFKGKVSGKFAHTFGFNIEQIKATSTINDWSVKVTKLTSSPQSSDTVELQNAIYVDSIEAAIADKLEYPFTAYVGGVIDAEAFSSIPARGYEIDGKLIQVPTNHYPLDYNGRKLILSDASNFSIGDVISQTLSISSLVAAGTDEEGYTATATVSAHGVATGETFKATIATTATQDEDFFEGEFVCTAASSTTFTYTLNKPFDETANSGVGAYKTITSTTCTGTKTAVMFSGGLVDKKVSNTLYLRNVSGSTSAVTGTISNGTNTGTVTSASQVFIPANYRRIKATEKPGTAEQDWDGTYYSTWCNNPAWVFHDLIVNKIYGLGNYVDNSQINKWELFQIGRYCDELVPAGVAAADLLSIHCTADTNYIPSGSTGEHEPRFSANLVIGGKQEAYKVLNDVSSIFRGMSYWLNGEAFVVQDSEKDPVYQFTNANVINGEFKYEGTANKTRTNSIMVNWNNPQDYYRSRTEIVELEESLQKDDEWVKPEATTAFGCTSRGQARRLGKWKLLTNNLNTNTVTFETSLNAAFLRPGDIVQVIDQHKEGKSWGGRISNLQTGSGTDRIIRLDREPSGFDGASNAVETGYAVGDYRLTCSFVGYKAILAQDTATIGGTAFVRGDHLTSITTEEAALTLQDDSNNLVFVQWTPFTYTETRTLDQVNGTDSLRVSVAFTVKPTAESIWILSRAALQTGKTKQEAKLFRMMAMVEKDRNLYEITALEYNASKFDAIDKNEALTQDRTIFLPDSFKDVPAVTNIDADPKIKAAGTGGTVNSIIVEWDPATNSDGTPYTSVRHYEVEFSNDNDIWRRAGTSTSSDFEILDTDKAVLSGTYYFKVYVVNLNGVRGPVTASAGILVDFNRAVGPAEGSVGTDNHFINFMGNISGGFSLGAGTVSFSPANYQHNDGRNEHAVTGQGQLDFTGLTGSNSDNNGANTGYVFFDHSANVFKAIAFDTVSGQFYPVGSSVFSTATGTLTASTSSNPKKFTGLDSTNFDGELAVNNVFKYTKDATDYYHRVKRFTSDSELFTFQPTRNTLINSGNQAFSKPNFLADYKNDTIMGKVVKDGSNAYTLQTFGSSQGEPGYSIFGTNESHTFAASASGTITQSNYTAYTCDFTVKKGSTAYAYAASGTAQNTFGITFVSKVGFANNADINISSAGQITIDDNSLDSVSSGSVTLRITDLANGETITDRVLSFAKANAGVNGTGSSAVTIKLLANKHVVPYTQAGTESTTITLSTEVQNVTELSGTAFFDFDVDTNNNGTFTDKQNSTTGTFTLADADEPANGDLVVIRVQLRDGATDGTVIATDIVTVYGVKDGTDAYTVINSNNAHTLPTTTAGVVTHSGSGTDIRVFKGSTPLTATTGTPSSGQFKVTVTSDTDITVDSSPSIVTKTTTNDTVRFSDHSGMSANTAEIEYAVLCESIQTVTTSQTFSKSQQGATGTAALSGFLTNENTSALAYNYIGGSILNYLGTGGEFKTFTGTTELTSGVTYAGGATKNGLTLAINSSTGVYTLSGASWSTDAESFDLTATKGSDVLTKTFSINKLVNSGKVEIVATGHQFAYDTNSANPSPSSVTLTAESFGYNLTPQYKWEKSTNAGSSFTTVSDFSSTDNITVSAGAFSTGTELYRVTMKSNNTSIFGSGGISVDTDSVTVARIKDGAVGDTGPTGPEPITEDLIITVVSSGGNKYAVGGVTQKALTLLKGFTYKFDQSASSNSNHPIQFSTTSNGTHGGGSAYTTGVTHVGTPGNAGAFTTFKVPNDAPAALYYYCAYHSGMGGSITTEDLASGEDGAVGKKVAEIELYYAVSTWNANASATTFPNSAPSTGTYNFGTNVVASIPSGWSQTKAAGGRGVVVSISRALVTEATSGGNVSGSISWSTPSLTSKGFADTNFIFLNHDGNPGTPTATSYPNIPTNNPNAGDNWSDSPPSAESGKQLWSSKGVASITGTYPSITFNYAWEAPVIHVQDKADISLDQVDNKSGSTIRSEIDEDDIVGVGKCFTGGKPNKTTFADSSTEGIFNFQLDGATAVGVNVFSSAERTKLNRLRLGRAPDSDTILISNAGILEADIVGSGKTFGAGQKPNKTTFADSSTEGIFNFQLDGATATAVNVFSSAERTKLDRLRSGQNPANASQSILNNNIAINTTTGVLSGIGTGNSSRVFNDVIGIGLDTTTNVGRITISGIGASNTTVDVTKGNLGLDYTDGADVTSSGTANNVSNVGNQSVANAQQGIVAANLGFTTAGVIKKTVPKEQGGFGLNVATLFGSTVGRFPRWNGSAFVSVAEDDFKNSELSSSDVTGGLGFTPGTSNFGGNWDNLGGTIPSTVANASITEAQLTTAGAVTASDLEYGEIAVSVGVAATSWSFNAVSYTPAATTQTVTMTISHPTFGTSTIVGTWTRTDLTISGFALGTATGMSGSGNNTWSFGDVDSDAGSADNAFGATTANNALKTIFVQHSASNKRFEITAQVFSFTFTIKCLTPAMLPENLQIGDEVDSPLGKTKVIDMQYKEREGYYILEDELEITNDHPILIDGEWILAEEYTGKKEYIDKPTEVVYVETENELLTVKNWTVGGKY